MGTANGAGVRRRGRGAGRVVVTAVLVAGCVAGGWYAFSQGWVGRLQEQLNGTASAEPSRPALPPATVTIERRTLVQTEEVDGRLGYGDEYQLKSARQGVVTRLPAEGSTIGRGKAVYWLDNEPVVLLDGSLPVYRPLADGADDGSDVRQLEQNLAALGYDGFTVDDEFTGNTAEAVRQWQADLGIEETGRVQPGQVVFLPDPIRISSLKAQVGDRVGNGPLLTYTGTERVVSVDLDVDERELVREGLPVTVRLPDESELKGTISEIGAVARTSGGQNGEEEVSTVALTVDLADAKPTGGFDQAPVDVEIVSDERKNVLTVPVSALLALREGGYGVEVVEGGRSRIAAIDVGLFANGQVEVSGPGIRAGMKVGVPKS